MRLSALRFGINPKNLPKIRGVIYFKISPFEQRAFANVLTKGIPNTFRRIREQFFRVTPPFAIAYLIYDWTEREHKKGMRKDPSKYVNDE